MRTQDRDRAIVAAHDRGVRSVDLAAEWGLTPARIAQILRAAGRTRPKPTGETRDRILAAYDPARTVADIAHIAGASPAYVSRVLAAAGYQRRHRVAQRTADQIARDTAAAMALHGAGWTHREIAAALGRTIGQVTTDLTRRDAAARLPASRRRSVAGRDAEIVARWAAGESVSSLAQIAGISRQRVYQIIHRYQNDETAPSPK